MKNENAMLSEEMLAAVSGGLEDASVALITITETVLGSRPLPSRFIHPPMPGNRK